jgi:hypothetical protein
MDAPASKKNKLADPVKASIDQATQMMLERAQKMQIETVFDRAENMKQCNIGTQGTCCKNCGMGPCRLPLLKIDLKNSNSISPSEYESVRQELGVTINASLSGPRIGKWIGGRVKKNTIMKWQ